MHYRGLSERNRIRPVLLESPRGAILDRSGKALVANRLAFDCYVVPEEAEKDLAGLARELAALAGVPEDALVKRFRALKREPLRPIVIAKDVDREKAFAIEERIDRLPGVFIQTRPVRHYAIGKAGSHVLGYLGAIGPQEYARLKHYGYRMTDWIGRTGLERAYESYLRGKHGAWQFEADSRGNLIRALSIQEPVEGQSLQTTIDRDLQILVSDYLADQTGAIAVMDLRDGSILAWASAPAYDPNLFIRHEKEAPNLRRLLDDPREPLLDRVIQGEYPPGSAFKIVTASAGLRSGQVQTDTRYFCPGSFSLGDHTFRCWLREGHGAESLEEAIEHSCNVFFFHLAQRIGVSALAREAELFGFGRRTGVDLEGEKVGLVPTPQWKREARGESWYPGETLIFGIGQGALVATPLQVLRSASVISSGGYLVEPHLAKRIGRVDMKVTGPKKVGDDGQGLERIRRGMTLVVQSPRGTGQRAYSDLIPISGKTGTAEAGDEEEDHAWFVGYAPSDEPEYSLVVFLEHGGKGGFSAADIGGRVFSWMAQRGFFKKA